MLEVLQLLLQTASIQLIRLVAHRLAVDALLFVLGVECLVVVLIDLVDVTVLQVLVDLGLLAPGQGLDLLLAGAVHLDFWLLIKVHAKLVQGPEHVDRLVLLVEQFVEVGLHIFGLYHGS